MTLTVQDYLEIWRISILYCYCFPCIQVCSSIGFSSMWTFTNWLFIIHCISNYRTTASRKLYNHTILEQQLLLYTFFI